MRTRKSQMVIPETEQPIGHITTPIEDNAIEQVRTILIRHGIELHKIRTPDNWWLLLLPDGTIKVNMQAKVPLSTVRLPDGFKFFFEEGIFYRDDTYATPPKIDVQEELEGE